MGLSELIKKYSGPGPRYTSYPTAPQWQEGISKDRYAKHLASPFNPKREPMGIYVHLPFCEELCYYCGCNIQITKDKGRSHSYVQRVMEEMEEVARLLGENRSIGLVSWGGGTPTFLSVDEIRSLHEKTRSLFNLIPDAEVSLEIDPRVTSLEQLTLLKQLGFNRVSLGVQDFDKAVQAAVHRNQTLEQTEEMLNFCRKLGFKGINHDYIYGLPLQTVKTFEKTIDEIIRIKPDRIALFNYAHLPNMIKHQSILDQYPMPKADERVNIFTMAFERLTKAGYVAIGMDHFALSTDELTQAAEHGKLHRNFQGYTIKHGKNLLGFGASAIGEIGDAYFQNVRSAKDYEEKIARDKLATFRGCFLTEEDKERKWLISHVLCEFEIVFDEYEKLFGQKFKEEFRDQWSDLEAFAKDGIIMLTDHSLRVTPLGRLFVRNVAMTFDAYLDQSKIKYSQTV